MLQVLYIEHALTDVASWSDCACNIHNHLSDYEIILNNSSELQLLGFLDTFIPMPIKASTFPSIGCTTGMICNASCFLVNCIIIT